MKSSVWLHGYEASDRETFAVVPWRFGRPQSLIGLPIAAAPRTLGETSVRSIYSEIGDSVRFSKTVSEADVYMYAGITGDFSGNHVNEAYMKKSKYGSRIAHGALIVGFMSTASSLMMDRSLEKGIDFTPVSLGYDRVRFLAPVFFGDTVDVVYTISEVDEARGRTRAEIKVLNQDGILVAVGEHLGKWVPNIAPEDVRGQLEATS